MVMSAPVTQVKVWLATLVVSAVEPVAVQSIVPVALLSRSLALANSVPTLAVFLIQIVKLNVDENPQISAQFQIRSIPTLLIFKNGKVVDQIVGAVPKQAIAARLNAQL